MSEAEHLFGDAHVRRYRETGGEVGHIWKRGAKILLLTTAGRRSGEPYTVPLIYPEVEVQVLDDVFAARARTAEGEERERAWQLAARQWPDYDAYQTRTDREIPVVVLERR